MNRRIILPILILVLIAAVSAAAQMTVTGEVTDVIDGKTVVISMPTGKVKAELQYIEVPEAGQQYHDIVIEHLRAMVLGKMVEYRARTIFKDHTVGRMLLNGVDVSQQLLRDGAAWHIPVSVSGQELSEVDTYASTENDAKNEKRGIWSIAGLKPAWEFRAEKAAVATGTPPPSLSTEPRPVKPVVIAKAGYWGDTNPVLGNIGALANGYNAETKSGYIGTSFLPINPLDIEKATGISEAVDITYFYKLTDGNKKNGVYVLTFASLSPSWLYLTRNDLIVTTDGKSTVIGKAKRTSKTDGNNVQERLTYTVPRRAIVAIANGSEVVLKVGDRICVPKPGLQFLLYNLLQVSE